ncbi:SF3a splicing factor complex subunit, partial [Cladochytrium tenue]
MSNKATSQPPHRPVAGFTPPLPPQLTAATAASSATSKGGIRIKADYVPKAKRMSGTAGGSSASSASQSGAVAGGGSGGSRGRTITQLCPRCKRAIPVSEMDEHVRIELLDPKWREQRDRAASNLASSNLLSGGVIAENLKRISTFRSDIFDGDENQRIEKMKELSHRAKVNEDKIWDGHTASITSVQQKAFTLGLQELLAKRTIEEPDDDAFGPLPKKTAMADVSVPRPAAIQPYSTSPAVAAVATTAAAAAAAAAAAYSYAYQYPNATDGTHSGGSNTMGGVALRGVSPPSNAPDTYTPPAAPASLSAVPPSHPPPRALSPSNAASPLASSATPLEPTAQVAPTVLSTAGDSLAAPVGTLPSLPVAASLPPPLPPSVAATGQFPPGSAQYPGPAPGFGFYGSPVTLAPFPPATAGVATAKPVKVEPPLPGFIPEQHFYLMAK